MSDPSPDDGSAPTSRGVFPGLREFSRTFLIGVCMGSADAVPGVSGGTVALIAGIYGRLIGMVTAVTPRRVWRLLRAVAPYDGSVSGREASTVWGELDGWFGLALAAGVVTAVIVVTRVVHVVSRTNPTLLFGFFFGLIAASAVILIRELEVTTAFQAGAATVGFAVAFVLSGSATVLGGGGSLVVFVSGAVAVSAMILPGVSGSLLLVVLGQYTRLSTALTRFVDALAASATGAPADLTEHGTVVAAFVAGGLVGLFTVSRAVRFALDRNRRATMAFLVALVVGALRAPVERVGTEVGFSVDVAVAFALAAAVGAIALLLLDRYAVDLDLDTVDASR
jgi:putative membrane protein